MHYCIGNEILKSVGLNLSLFTIGNLSPDAHDGSTHGNAYAHYKTAYKFGVDKYPVVDLEAFKSKYLLKTYDDFILGYYCHLITDNMWSKSVYFEYIEGHEDERNTRVEMFYNDYFTLNKVLLERFNLNNVILHVPEQISIEEITSENLQRVVHEFYNDFNRINKNEVLTILNIQFILNFIRNAAEECLQEIKDLMKKEQLIIYP